MPVVSDPTTLSEFPLFRDLTIEQLTRLNDLLRRRTFPAGTNLASAEEPGEVVYLILNGTVKIFVTHNVNARGDRSSVARAAIQPESIAAGDAARVAGVAGISSNRPAPPVPFIP